MFENQTVSVHATSSGEASTPVEVSGESKGKKNSLAGELLGIGKTLLLVLVGYTLLATVIAAYEFPRQVDEAATRSIPAASSDYYARIYTDHDGAAYEEDSPEEYVDVAQEVIEDLGVKQVVEQFVSIYGLQNKKVLDVGSGTGYLQDLVDDYVGLDISPTASRFYHKPFVEASATEMPIPDNEFDVAWTVFVLEHVPTPEQALMEMRRVVKDGGLLYLAPAWDCRPWAADGIPVRSYGDLTLEQKMVKAAIPVLEFAPFRLLIRGIKRIGLRAAHWGEGPTHLRYRLLEPNYEKYWMADSDALNDIDRDETLTWFRSRGDECLNCDEENPLTDVSPLIIRVHK